MTNDRAIVNPGTAQERLSGKTARRLLPASWCGVPAALLVSTWLLPYHGEPRLYGALVTAVAWAAIAAWMLLARAGTSRPWGGALLAVPALAALAVDTPWATRGGPWPSHAAALAGATALTACAYGWLLARTHAEGAAPLVAGCVFLTAVAAEVTIKARSHPVELLGDKLYYEQVFEREPVDVAPNAELFHLFRGRKPAQPKLDRFRVVFLGGSVTYGWKLPVDSDSDYPARFQALAGRTGSGRPIEAVNAGVPSFTSVEGLVLFREKIAQLEPDLVIVFYGLNDFAADRPGGGLDLEMIAAEQLVASHPWLLWYRKLVRRSGLYLCLTHSVLQAWTALRERLSSGGGPPRVRVTRPEYEAAMKQFIRLSRAGGWRLAFSGDLFSYDLGRPCGSGREWPWGTPAVVAAQQLAASSGVAWLDIRRGLCAPGLKVSDVFCDVVHLTPLGHELVARELVRQCRQQGLLR